MVGTGLYDIRIFWARSRESLYIAGAKLLSDLPRRPVDHPMNFWYQTDRTRRPQKRFFLFCKNLLIHAHTGPKGGFWLFLAQNRTTKNGVE